MMPDHYSVENIDRVHFEGIRKFVGTNYNELDALRDEVNAGIEALHGIGYLNAAKMLNYAMGRTAAMLLEDYDDDTGRSVTSESK